MPDTYCYFDTINWDNIIVRLRPGFMPDTYDIQAIDSICQGYHFYVIVHPDGSYEIQGVVSMAGPIAPNSVWTAFGFGGGSATVEAEGAYFAGFLCAAGPTTRHGTVIVTIGPVPAPDENQTKQCDLKTGCPDCPGKPMASYSIHLMLASLHIEDTPISYNSPREPSTDFKVTYNQREANQPGTFDYSNLGPKWTFNWLSYVTDDGSSAPANPTVYVRGGGTEVFGGYDSSTHSYAPDRQTLAILVRNQDGTYEKRFPDGSKEVFSKQGSNHRFFLTSIVDATGTNSTTLSYHPDGTLRITAITDSISNPPTTLIYDPIDTYRIKEVHDPFGRVAQFWYTSGKLTKITDPIGIESQFEYESGTDFIKTLTTPYGATAFAQGIIGDSVRWLEVTDPLGGKERVEYNEWALNAPTSEPSPPPGVNNSDLHFQNTYYWDKKAMADTPRDYSKAQVFHWLATPNGKVSGIKHSEKKPLENRVWYTYKDQSDPKKVGSLASPNKVVRLLGDGTTQLSQYSYNSLGNLLTETDPVGRVKSYVYDTNNNIDVLTVYQRNPSGASADPYAQGQNADKIAAHTYNSLHEPLTDTDASGQVTTYTYNTSGQVLTRTNAKSETTAYAYGGTVPAGYLESITSPAFNGSSTITTFTYDGANRVRTVTNRPDDYTVSTEYDNLDRKTMVTYPDGTSELFEYIQDFGQGPKVILDLTGSRDRLGRWTRRHYNQNRQMDSITDAADRTTLYGWCTCGSLTSITDPNWNLTTFVRDLQSRVTSKVFGDGAENSTTTHYTYENTTSRLKSLTDALNRRTNYSYFIDNNMSEVSYTNTFGNPLIPSTPSVSYTYDPNYNRVATMTDGTGLTTYAYYSVNPSPALGAGKLQSIDGPFSNDTITYTYDELGRVLNQDINGATASMTYDSLGRLGTTTNRLGSFTRDYDGVTSRLQMLTYPNGQTANYTYFGNDNDRRLQTLQHSTSGFVNLSRHDYTYDAEGEIGSWSKMLGLSTLPLWFEYDDARQLLNAHDVSTYAFDFAYDLAGNRISDYAHDQSGNIHVGVLHEYTANSLNQLDTVTTTVNMLPSTQQVLSYDADGNMTADAAHKSYEWDAANRLVAINYTDTGNRTEFAYNGLGQRVKITEYGPGVTAVARPTKAVYSKFEAGPFTLPAGGCNLTLQGLNPNGGNNAVLVDSVTLNGVLVAHGSFESPSVTDYQNNPTGTAWTFLGSAGVAANGGTYTQYNPNAPAGNQVAFVKNNGLLSQSWSAFAGTYLLQIKAAQRGSGNDSYQQLRVNVRSSSSVISVKTFLWCGNQICEERDGTGLNVTKRFFAEGEELVGGSGAGNYYFSRDHLGSIREVTDSSGNVNAQYDYDAWGNAVVVDGKMNVDFGYTGHYFHQPSGLNLTLYRAYNSAIGRWISRDPLKDAEILLGTNLYTYVDNDPINKIDRLGLRGFYVDAYGCHTPQCGLTGVSRLCIVGGFAPGTRDYPLLVQSRIVAYEMMARGCASNDPWAFDNGCINLDHAYADYY